MLTLQVTLPSVTTAQEPPAESDPVVVSAPVPTYVESVNEWLQAAFLTWIAAGLAIATTISAFKTAFLAPLRNTLPILETRLYGDEYNPFTVWHVVILASVVVLAWLGFESDYVNVFANTPITPLANAPEVLHMALSVFGIVGMAVTTHEIYEKLTE